MVVSASSNRAIEFATFTKRLLTDIPFLNEMLPDKRKGHRDSVLSFDVNGKRPSHAPSVKAVGITGQITGSRADIIIGDDIEIPNNSFSAEMREKLIQRTNEFINILKPNGQIIYLGTPQSQESIYNKIPKSGMFKTVIFPVYYPSNIDIYDGNLSEMLMNDLAANPDLTGKPTDPERFDEIEIEKRKAILTSQEFQLQYMLDTTLSDIDKYPLKLKDAIVMPLDIEQAPLRVIWSNSSKNKIKELPNLGLKNDGFYEPAQVSNEFMNYEYKIMAIDPSGRGKDETAYCVLGILGAKLFVLDFGGFQGGYDEVTLVKLVQKAKDYKVNKILIEANYGDGMFTSLFKPKLLEKYTCNIEEVKNYTNKEKRIIDTLEPVLTQHRLIFNYDSIERDVRMRTEQDWFKYSLAYQMSHITYEKRSISHDDRLDALAMAVAYFRQHLGVDEDKKVGLLKQRQLQKEIDSYFEDLIGNIKKPKDIREKFLKKKLKNWR